MAGIPFAKSLPQKLFVVYILDLSVNLRISVFHYYQSIYSQLPQQAQALVCPYLFTNSAITLQWPNPFQGNNSFFEMSINRT